MQSVEQRGVDKNPQGRNVHDVSMFPHLFLVKFGCALLCIQQLMKNVISDLGGTNCKAHSFDYYTRIKGAGLGLISLDS